MLFRCNIAINQYQHNSKISSTFVPNNSFSHLLKVSPTNRIYSETIHLEFLNIETCFADQNSMLLEIGDIANWNSCNNDKSISWNIQSNLEINLLPKTLHSKYRQKILILQKIKRQILSKLLWKEQSKKKQKQLVI